MDLWHLCSNFITECFSPLFAALLQSVSTERHQLVGRLSCIRKSRATTRPNWRFHPSDITTATESDVLQHASTFHNNVTNSVIQGVQLYQFLE
jgi:hypothetical protein